MSVRAIDLEGDWLFGKGRNDYKRNLKEVMQDIETRLKSHVGDCFFKTDAGIDWFNLLGSKNIVGLNIAINATILNTQFVTGIVQVSQVVLTNRKISFIYQVQTIYGDAGAQFNYDIG